jgi:hypothetical protein
MNVATATLKTILFSALAALVLGFIGGVIAGGIAEIVVPGDNPHTDQLEKLGMAMVGAAVGAALGAVAVVSRVLYKLLRSQRLNSETQR